MKIKIWKFLIMLLFPITIFTQTLNVHKNDGTVYNVDIIQIDSITFNSATKSWTSCPGTPTVSYEGQIYNTVLIGNQCWLKENLNVGTKIDGYNDDRENPQTDNGIIEKYCYMDDPENCAKYGGLYQWFEATKYFDLSSYDCNESYDLENVQGICPVGWHLPNENDYDILRQTASESGNALREVGQSNNDDEETNSSGFSALLGGRYSHQTGYSNYQSLENSGIFLSTNIDLTINCAEYTSSMSIGPDDYIGFGRHGTDMAESVRCIKD